jgi:endo-1,4-beta-mannosidase
LGSSHTKTDPAEEKTILSIYFKSAAVLGGLFALTDFGGGKEYTLTPKNLTVTLTKADGVPRVDTMLIDADDLRNIKWIRVRRD